MQNLAGTYVYGKEVEKETIGSLMTYSKDGTTVLFGIDLLVGPPSYNSGQPYDTPVVKNFQIKREFILQNKAIS